ncbi:tRNA splicing endonuclease subunit sen2 [Friedmanniomyces endolithicus]|nr:tRNA splicing endonuclease subunit sen2 [Friedmanniomyces endolithicus]KAK1825314.1 tRNA splicing endonuclease subunit sen2 [Friedmanniomyces endolithicus]
MVDSADIGGAIAGVQRADEALPESSIVPRADEADTHGITRQEQQTPKKRPPRRKKGHFSSDTRSIHVTDPAHIRALWEMGFFGKASLSRSEPTWLDREKARLRAEADGMGGARAAEVVTNARREERRLFKLERARAEREKIERQRAVEQGRVAVEKASDPGLDPAQEFSADPVPAQTSSRVGELDEETEGLLKKRQPMNPEISEHRAIVPAALIPGSRADGFLASLANGPVPCNGRAANVPNTGIIDGNVELVDEKKISEPNIQNQEHLQLTLEEAFFLSSALGVLHIELPDTKSNAPSSIDLLTLFAKHASFPPPTKSKARPLIPVPSLAVNNQPLHARAVSHAIAVAPLVRDPTESSLRVPITATPLSPQPPHLVASQNPLHPLGSQQLPAPDNHFLLNYVVYHHFRSLGWVVRPGLKFGADYMLYNRGPVFSHAEFAVIILPSYTDAYWETSSGRRERRVKVEKDWWWLHCVNRVQSQVKKTLVLCYVDVPAPDSGQDIRSVSGDVDVAKLLRRYKVREFVIKRWAVNRSRE